MLSSPENYVIQHRRSVKSAFIHVASKLRMELDLPLFEKQGKERFSELLAHLSTGKSPFFSPFFKKGKK